MTEIFRNRNRNFQNFAKDDFMSFLEVNFFAQIFFFWPASVLGVKAWLDDTTHILSVKV